ncbi:MAG: preprotein translocase subunit SecA [Longimicrobiales bacterium]|nr:preprotein translocase subunit SecA [Longimicrobiales bacterium]
MLKTLIKKVIGDPHQREVNRLQPLVEEINAYCEDYASLSDEKLRARTDDFKARIADATAEVREKLEDLRAEKRASEVVSVREELSVRIGDLEARHLEILEETLEELLPEAFAVVKDTCRRLVGQEVAFAGTTAIWDMVPYDVQLIGGIALHRGKAAEMQTGEGKTLAATMPVYLNALTGRGVHVVTVNSYLARRDAEWMGAIYRWHGLTVEVIDGFDPGSPERREAYHADITYGTNNEFGFDYLRDNMVHSIEQRVQREHAYAIIDEVDSILIDEARTPLIISGPVAKDSSDAFQQYNPLVRSLHAKQSALVNTLVSEAERELEEEGHTFEAGEKLLAARRGAPRHRKLMKMLADEPALQGLVQKVEGDFMREKRLHEVDELLYYAMDEKGHNVHLSDRGLDELSPQDPDAFVIPDLSEVLGAIEKDPDLSIDERNEKLAEVEAGYAAKNRKLHVIHQLLKAYTLYHKDERYIIGEDGGIVIVDEFTGRQMPGRRWSDGLHQAVEAKEGVEVKGETQTLATITIQNFFRMYDKLAGMTGTAETEETEFHQIYGLDVLVIPTNRPVIRDDRNDLIFRTAREKYNALMDEVERLHRLELPVLVGTTNVEVSETFSRMLKRRGIRHDVLNAKQHQRESEIVAGAGQPGAVTIATNMAGRGTDIKLGKTVTDPRTVGWCRERGLDLGEAQPIDPTRWDDKIESRPDDHVIEVGGLHILGSERHESRRIDRQLRGRAGRQGDPGASQFFLSLEDNLMRLFGGMERIAGVMEKMGAEEGEVITAGLVTKSIERAQKRVEGNNFEARKRLLDYDDVMNQQREVIYDLRLFALEGGEDLKGEVFEMIDRALADTFDVYMPEGVVPDAWELAALKRKLLQDYFLAVDRLPDEDDPQHEFERWEIEEWVVEAAREHFHRKLESFGEHGERVLSIVLLTTIDEKWKDHLYDLDHLKASIGFRGWGQKDPLVEYKTEAFDMFVDLLEDLRGTVSTRFFRAQLNLPHAQQQIRPTGRMTLSGPGQPGSRSGARSGGRGRGAGGRSAGGSQPGDADSRSTVDPTGIAATARADHPAGGVAGGAGIVLGGTAEQGGQTDLSRLQTNRGEGSDGSGSTQQPVTVEDEPGRNDPCPCGSGKKYKKCHGR